MKLVKETQKKAPQKKEEREREREKKGSISRREKIAKKNSSGKKSRGKPTKRPHYEILHSLYSKRKRNCSRYHLISLSLFLSFFLSCWLELQRKKTKGKQRISFERERERERESIEGRKKERWNVLEFGT
jgi:hypothetical protein